MLNDYYVCIKNDLANYPNDVTYVVLKSAEDGRTVGERLLE
jgi:hypothetical protein